LNAQRCLPDLNHGFDRRPGTPPSTFSERRYPGPNRLGLDRNLRRDVGRRLTSLDFDIGSFGKFDGGYSHGVAIRSAAISMSRSTTHCSDRTVRAGWHPESYGIDDRCIFPHLASEKKNCVPSRQRRSLDNKSARCAPSRFAHKKI